MFGRSTSIIIAIAGVATLATPAHAYIDAGSGSYLVQVLIAGSLGALYSVKGYIGALISKKKRTIGN